MDRGRALENTRVLGPGHRERERPEDCPACEREPYSRAVGARLQRLAGEKCGIVDLRPRDERVEREAPLRDLAAGGVGHAQLQM